VDADERLGLLERLGRATNLDPRTRHGLTLAMSSTTIAARPCRRRSRYFFARAKSWPVTSIVS
jgi:hypothetical protein